MDFTLTDEQALLRDTAERLSADAGPDREAAWRGCVETGLLGVAVPAERGGFGGGVIEAALVAEAFGHKRVVVPFVASVVGSILLTESPSGAAHLGPLMAGTLRVALAAAEPGSRYSLVPRTIARRDGAGFRLAGAKTAVPDGATADLFIVSALVDGAVSLFLVPRASAGLNVRDYRAVDGHSLCDLGFDGLLLDEDALLLGAPHAAKAAAQAVDTGSLLLAAEAVGAMTAATEATAAYLKTRHQFGRPLSSFQVLAHRVADMGVKLDNARSMLLRGLALPENPAAVSATMVAVLQAAELVCGQAIQLHGGIGMTEELAIGHYYKRVRAIGRTYGDIRHHLRRYADLTLPTQEAA